MELCDALRLKHSEVKWAVFKISDRQTITLERTLVRNVFDKSFEKDQEQFAALKEHLELSKPRYILYNFTIAKDGSRQSEQLAFIYW